MIISANFLSTVINDGIFQFKKGKTDYPSVTSALRYFFIMKFSNLKALVKFELYN